MHANEYLNAAKSALKLPSDYALAKRLGYTTAWISAIRHGKTGTFDNECALKIAEILDLPPLEIVADMEGQKARKDSSKLFWDSVKKRTAGTTAAILTTVVLCATPDAAQAASLIPTGLPTDSLCIMRVMCGVQGIVEQLFKPAITRHMLVFCAFGYYALCSCLKE